MFANVNAVITTTYMPNDVMTTMLMLVENAGLICDKQTFFRSQICFYRKSVLFSVIDRHDRSRV